VQLAGGCGAPDDSDASAETFVSTCPATEPVAGSACTGDPTSTPSTFNHGCDFSRGCGVPGAYHDALYVCIDSKWERRHSEGCNPPPPSFDAGVDSGSDAMSDASDAAVD
jgi:hypothetical protein